MIRAAKNGQDAAWTEVFQRYERMLVGYLRTWSAGKPRIDQRDLVEATFELAWRQIERFEYKGEGSFRRWLVTLARNLFLNEVKALSKREVRADTAVLAGVADEKGAASERTRGENEDLYAALGQLEEGDREILLMHYHEGFSLSRIAEILDCSHKTATTRRREALGRLRLTLGARPDPE